MNIELHIEEMILHGFAPGDRDAIADAVRGELMRLFAEGGIRPALEGGGEMARIDGGAFDVRHGAGAEAIGTWIAERIHGGLSR